MFTDELRSKVWDEIRQHELRAFLRLLPATVFVEAAKEAGVRLGTSALCLPTLVMLAIASALHSLRSFADVLVLTLKLLEDAEGWPQSSLAKARRKAARKGKSKGKGKRKRSKHNPYGGDPTKVNEEAFVQARKRMPIQFWISLLLILTSRFQAQHGRWLQWHQFRLLALDGTTIDVPNYPALREHFGCAKNGRGKQRRTRAQARMVMLQFPLARMPLRYELCPLKQGERTIAARLLVGLSPFDLVLMDRGFWSFGLFWQVQLQQAYFAIRLCAGVRLQTIRRLGPNDRLVRWTPSDRKWRRQGLPKSMVLRVIDYQIPGFRSSAVVTNVLDPQQISAPQWVHLATKDEEGQQRLRHGLYHRRWEIETTFHEIKVVQQLKGHLRSRTPEGIAFEIAGHVLLYLLVRWLMVEAAEEAGVDPLQLSFKGALEELLDMRASLITSSPQHVRRVLLPRLLERIAAHRVPFRPGRHYPRPGDTKTRNRGNGKKQLPAKLPTMAA